MNAVGLGERETGTTHGCIHWLGKNMEKLLCHGSYHPTGGGRVLFHISLVGFQHWLQGTGAGKLDPSLPLPQRPIPPTANSYEPQQEPSLKTQSMDDLRKIFGGLTGTKPSKSWDIPQESLILIHWFCGTFYRRPGIFSPNCKVTTVFFSFKPIQGTKEGICGWSPELDKGHAYGWSRTTHLPRPMRCARTRWNLSQARDWPSPADTLNPKCHNVSIKQVPSHSKTCFNWQLPSYWTAS